MPAGELTRGVPASLRIELGLILANVLHDWDGLRAVAILAKCRKAMISGARVLIAERLIPDDPNGAVPVLLSGMNMLVFSGGQERTDAEYAALLTQASLAPGRVLSVAAPYGLIEGTAA